MNVTRTTHDPSSWGLSTDQHGVLGICSFSVTDLAKQYGTPLHVVHEARLHRFAEEFVQGVSRQYPGKISVHYAFKCNSVPGVVQTILHAGLKAEVMTPFELDLAVRMGVKGNDIIVNGPCKTEPFLRQCVDTDVRCVVVDSLDELTDLAAIARCAQKVARILLRVNPDYVPRGMNRGTATGSRTGCAFGLDLQGGEVEAALECVRSAESLAFEGFHLHIGTGIRHPEDYGDALRCVPVLNELAHSAGRFVRVLDVGGGFGSMTTRELTTAEMLIYQAFGRLPRQALAVPTTCPADFARAIVAAILPHFSVDTRPELVFEPGRCIVSPNMFLLLTVHRIKQRPGIGKWLITDGGLSTVSMPTYYEYHEVLLANDVLRPRSERATIIGPACFAGDIVYKNKWLPAVNRGEVLAIMDSGAYFTGLESSFGFQRSAIVGVQGDRCTLLRHRESLDEMRMRDTLFEREQWEVLP